MGKIMVVVFALLLYSHPAAAQIKPALERIGSTDFSVDFTGDFQKRTCSGGVPNPCLNGVRLDADNSGGLLVTFRHHFTAWSAIEVNYDYTRFLETYNTGSITRTRVDEVTLGYVLSLQSLTGEHFAPFAEVGMGALIFSPVSSNSGAITQDRAPVLYGCGIDLSDGGHLAVRFGYRGLIFHAPDFAVSNQMVGGISHFAEPYVGIVVRF
jgi:hypothetical protein